MCAAVRCTPLTAEGVVGAAFSIVYARLLRQATAGPLTGVVLGELMGMIVLPYRGAAAARTRSWRGRCPRGVVATAVGPAAATDRPWAKNPLQGVSMRLDVSHRAGPSKKRRRVPGCE